MKTSHFSSSDLRVGLFSESKKTDGLMRQRQARPRRSEPAVLEALQVQTVVGAIGQLPGLAGLFVFAAALAPSAVP
jgi:hypothetical protein